MGKKKRKSRKESLNEHLLKNQARHSAWIANQLGPYPQRDTTLLQDILAERTALLFALKRGDSPLIFEDPLSTYDAFYDAHPEPGYFRGRVNSTYRCIEREEEMQQEMQQEMQKEEMQEEEIESDFRTSSGAGLLRVLRVKELD